MYLKADKLSKWLQNGALVNPEVALLVIEECLIFSFGAHFWFEASSSESFSLTWHIWKKYKCVEIRQVLVYCLDSCTGSQDDL